MGVTDFYQSWYLDFYFFLEFLIISLCLQSSSFYNDDRTNRHLFLFLSKVVLFIQIYLFHNRLIDLVSPIAWETTVQSQVSSYQRFKKWYLIPPCLTVSIIKYVSRVKWSNPGEEVAPSPTLCCSSHWKGSPRLPSPLLIPVSWLTVVESDSKAPFSMATTPSCWGGRESLPWIVPLYPWSVSYKAECKAKRHQEPFFESLVWLDLELNSGFLGHWWTL